jgi:hypothetical protein
VAVEVHSRHHHHPGPRNRGKDSHLAELADIGGASARERVALNEVVDDRVDAAFQPALVVGDERDHLRGHGALRPGSRLLEHCIGLDEIDDEQVPKHDAHRLSVPDDERPDLEGLQALGGRARLSVRGD